MWGHLYLSHLEGALWPSHSLLRDLGRGAGKEGGREGGGEVGMR